MFPWVCLAEISLFFNCDWPKKINADFLSSLFCRKFKWSKQECQINSVNKHKDPKAGEENDKTFHNSTKEQCRKINKEKCENMTEKDNQEYIKNVMIENKSTNCEENLKDWNEKQIRINEINVASSEKLRTLIILAYCALQLFLPYSHFITKGYNNWTNGLYGYSWDMMVHTYETTLTTIKIIDNNNNEEHFLNPYAFTEYDRWTKYADMAWQYAHCIKRNIEDEFRRVDAKAANPLSSTNISIYFDIWCSMNGRFQQRVFDPRVDLLKAKWSPFEPTNWSLPLLNELNHMRPKLRDITNEVLNWNNFSDVVFVADLPGLTLENFISTDLTNVTLTVLEGSVRYRSVQHNEEQFLNSGSSMSLPIGAAHRITTLEHRPSCYIYTFTNKTMLLNDISIDAEIEWDTNKSILPLWSEFLERLTNYKRFLNHIANCLLFIFYKVPIPMELRLRY